MTKSEYHSWLRKVKQQELAQNYKSSIDKLQEVRGIISRILRVYKTHLGGEGSIQGNKVIRIK